MEEEQKIMLERCFKHYFTFSSRLAAKQHVEYQRSSEDEFINNCGKIFYSIKELVRLEDEWDNLTRFNLHHLEKAKWIEKKVMPLRKATQRLIFKNIQHNSYAKYVVDNEKAIINPKFIAREEELQKNLRDGIYTFLKREAEDLK